MLHAAAFVATARECSEVLTKITWPVVLQRESSPAKLASQPLVSLKRKRPPLLKITNDICTHSVEDDGTPQPVSAHSMNLCSPERAWETLDETSMEVKMMHTLSIPKVRTILSTNR